MPVAFVFLGDTGTGEGMQLAVARAIGAWCAARECDFGVLLGDNFYPDGVRSIDDPQWRTKFEEPYGALGLSFRAALGNHDHAGDVDAQVRYTSAAWSMPAAWYSYTEGGVDFFVLDTQSWGGEQRRWLRRALAASTAEWRVVYGHHPIVSYGEHGGTPRLRATLAPMLSRFDVNFYLSGHDHDKQVLAGSPAMVVVGTGGAKLRPPASGPETLFAASSAGFGYLSIDGDVATLEVVAADGTVEHRSVWER